MDCLPNTSFPWSVRILERSTAKATNTVDGVVHESTELLSERTEVRIRRERRSIGSAKHSVPVTEVSTTSDSIVFHDVMYDELMFPLM